MQKWFNYCLLALSVVFFNAWAGSQKIIYPSLDLMHIKAVQTVERDGDELYLDVTEYPSGGKARHNRLPDFPMNWQSRHLDKLKNVSIWSYELKPDESVTLILSLVEQDSPPWNTDDLIGSVRLHLKNTKGRLESSWSMPNRADPSVSVQSRRGKVEKFQLFGEHGKYELYFKLNLGKKPKA